MKIGIFDLLFLRIRLFSEESWVYTPSSGESSINISQGGASVGGAEISYDELMASYSSTTFAYISHHANIIVTTFSGSSVILNEPGLHGPTINLDAGADVKVVTNNTYFDERLRIQIGVRPIETVLVPVFHILGQSLGPAVQTIKGLALP